MLKQVQIDTKTWDTEDNLAINITNVTKTFEQWQRTNNFKDIISNLIKPQKRTITALDNVSFQVKKGEFVAYAGANGAGKSTTMKLLAGMLMPKNGDISILGLSPKRNRIKLMHKLGVLFGNRTELWWDHPIIQSYEWKKVVWNIDKKRYNKMLDMVVELLDLKGILNTFARELSLGQRMKADLGLMLLHEPQVILLDEPTLGLDVLAKRNMIDFLKRINKENKVTVVVTSHDMDDLEEMAHRIILLSKGKIAYDGGFKKLRASIGVNKTITITTKGTLSPVFNNAKLLSSEQNIHEYQLNKGVNIASLLTEIAQLNEVIDIETNRAPIEKIVAKLYKEWR
ncbi:ATP-binding cassette domain-containing protein [Clostridium sp. 'deep sea']|uniref:ABC transporter ATP-binding protein n=1 Tax=Clostridium sp. 'deep sea' TaxID=2779445 RepID=UPI0018964340|nr:ATP-binding cassette domain-containing protein [Clostridium sp. 'deep sea']QOR36801.1 ATP-binding cassette domain-containing protein [Clostridium sp. 'deep sea']